MSFLTLITQLTVHIPLVNKYKVMTYFIIKIYFFNIGIKIILYVIVNTLLQRDELFEE